MRLMYSLLNYTFMRYPSAYRSQRYNHVQDLPGDMEKGNDGEAMRMLRWFQESVKLESKNLFDTEQA